jgi:hypothetical protein
MTALSLYCIGVRSELAVAYDELDTEVSVPKRNERYPLLGTHYTRLMSIAFHSLSLLTVKTHNSSLFLLHQENVGFLLQLQLRFTYHAITVSIVFDPSTVPAGTPVPTGTSKLDIGHRAPILVEALLGIEAYGLNRRRMSVRRNSAATRRYAWYSTAVEMMFAFTA